MKKTILFHVHHDFSGRVDEEGAGAGGGAPRVASANEGGGAPPYASTSRSTVGGALILTLCAGCELVLGPTKELVVGGALRGIRSTLISNCPSEGNDVS